MLTYTHECTQVGTKKKKHTHTHTHTGTALQNWDGDGEDQQHFSLKQKAGGRNVYILHL